MMSEKKEQQQETVQETINRLYKLCQKLHEENERLKEKIRTFYGHQQLQKPKNGISVTVPT